MATLSSILAWKIPWTEESHTINAQKVLAMAIAGPFVFHMAASWEGNQPALNSSSLPSKSTGFIVGLNLGQQLLSSKAV